MKNFIDDSTSLEPLERFLLPFIDAEIAAKSKIVVGTPGSTFSTYVKTTLFNSYFGTKSSNIGKGSFGKDDTIISTSTTAKSNEDDDDDLVSLTTPISSKGKDRQDMLAAEKEIVKKPSKLDLLEDSNSKKPSTIGGALALTEKKKPSSTTTSDKVTTSEGDNLPDQLEEELKGELESAKEDKYLNEDEVKEKFKADKLASELSVHNHVDGDETLPKSLEKELEKSTSGKYLDPLPIEGPSDVSNSVQEELLKVKEIKFSDKILIGVPLKNEKEQIKDANLDLIQALKKEEVKYVDEPKKVVVVVEEVKEKSRLKPEIVVDEGEYSEEY